MQNGSCAHSLFSGTIRGNFFTTAVSSCIMVSMCSVLRITEEMASVGESTVLMNLDLLNEVMH